MVRHEHDHQLAAYCATCERWAVLDLERLIAEGRGDYCFVGRKPAVATAERSASRHAETEQAQAEERERAGFWDTQPIRGCKR